MRLVLALAAACAGGACASVTAGGVALDGLPHAYEGGPVTLRALGDPPGGRDLGHVEAAGDDGLDALVEAFVEQVRILGGNVGRIDRVVPRVEVRMRPPIQNMQCYGMRFSMNCAQAPYLPEEYPVLRIEGRAFRVERRP